MRTIDAHDSDSTDAQGMLVSSTAAEAGLNSNANPSDRNKVEASGVRKRNSIIISAVIVCAAAIAGTIYHQSTLQTSNNKASSAVAPPAVTVSKTTVKTQLVQDTVSVTGSVTAWDPLSVGAEAGGMRITSVSVEEGDIVRRGQVLATLNSSVLTSQLAQAKAKLASALASARKSIQPNRPEEIAALKDLLTQNDAEIKQEESLKREAQIKLKDGLVNAKRWNELSSSGVVSVVDAEAKKVAAETAREELDSAEAKLTALRSVSEQTREKLNQAKSGGRSEDIEISRATVAETKGHVEELEHQIEQTVIKSPDDGLIAKRDAHIGSITSVGTPLFSIIRLNRLELRAQIVDVDLAKFKVGQLVKIAVKEDDNGKIAGRVSLVSPEVDQTSRIGIVRISLPANAGLKPGMFVRGQVDMGHRTVLTVPNSSIITRNGESSVFTLSENKAIAIPVTVGVRTEKFSEISSGLKDGETIIDRGARFLSDHDVVRVEK